MSVPPTPSRQFSFALYVPLIALVGLGAHFSKNALAPAQPVLESMGLSPVLYAIIYDLPTIGAVIFPTMWGFLYMKAERLVLLMVPLGLLVSQAILVTSFILHDRWEQESSVSIGLRCMMVAGMLLISLFRAGAEVVQHTLLARVLPRSAVSGFVALVFCTHAIVVICNLLVPRVLTFASDPWHGVVLVQLLFLLPSFAGSLAAAGLCMCRLPDDACPEFASTFTDEEAGMKQPLLTVSGSLSVKPAMSTTSCSEGCDGAKTSKWVRSGVIVWAGLMVGLLHAFQSVTSKFIVSLGYSVTGAGDITARNQLIGLCILPLFGILSNRFEKRVLMVSASFVTVVSSAAIAMVLGTPLPAWVWQLALLGMAIVGVIVPVLGLAMIPEYFKEPGKAYGVLDSIKSLAQAGLVLIIGKMREVGGFGLATSFVFESFAFIGVLAVFAAWKRPSRTLK